MIAAEFSWVNLNSRERRMQILEMVLLLHLLLIMRNYEGWSGMRDPCIRKRVILILHIVHGDSNCSDHGGCPIKTISVAIVMSISWCYDETVSCLLTFLCELLVVDEWVVCEALGLGEGGDQAEQGRQGHQHWDHGAGHHSTHCPHCLIIIWAGTVVTVTWICWSVSLFVSPLFSVSHLPLSNHHTIIYSIWNRIQGQHKNNLPQPFWQQWRYSTCHLL